MHDFITLSDVTSCDKQRIFQFLSWYKPPHDKTKQNHPCAHLRIRSHWASAQSDQSSLSPQWIAKDPRFLHADSKVSNQTEWMLIWVFAGRICDLFGFVMLWLIFQRMKWKICISDKIYNFFTTWDEIQAIFTSNIFILFLYTNK